MITRILIAGVAIGALAAGGASAHTARHFHRAMREAKITYAAPAQPIPYAELDHYLRASPSERRSIEMAAGANTGAAANTSASMPGTSAPAPAAPDTSAPPPAAAMPDTSASPAPEAAPPAGTAVNPPADTTPPATPPPSAPQ